MNVGCVVMAAGRGQRFGGNKLLAPLAGAPLLSYGAGRASARRLTRIVAVVSDGEVEALCGACGVRTVRYPGGPQSDTVRLGIRQMADLDGCLFVQGDQPLLTAGSIERLLDSFAAAPGAVHRLSYDGVPGSRSFFPNGCFPLWPCSPASVAAWRRRAKRARPSG